MDYTFNSPDLLPPPGADLVILVDGQQIEVRRTGYIKRKTDVMEYEGKNRRKFYGRFPWTYK